MSEQITATVNSIYSLKKEGNPFSPAKSEVHIYGKKSEV